ncbi:BglG family transcription antiterminator LicT [Enterococcus sp. 2201sp1_2201st1_B8_2201SCRN_220225]|uniref:BglG family transcription antiterminator LicT n=1 Tax=unclassified Enterococcus TaxID=2608891 RepID=UPI0034A24607
MVIEKIVNNNVVFSRDENGDEIVVAGRGIAFQRKPGAKIPLEDVEKIFHIQMGINTSRLDKLLAEVPLAILELTDDLLAYGRKLLKVELSDSLVLSLGDHIATVVKRAQEGILLVNPAIWEIKRFYHEEYLVGVKGLELIQERLGVTLPEDEAAFIAIHFVNAINEGDSQDLMRTTRLMQEITNVIKYHFNQSFDEESAYYYRFITHLKFFSERVIRATLTKEEEDTDLYDLIKSKYPNSFICVQKICQLLKEKYQCIVTKEEQVYLTIHIQRLVYKTSKD